ncbi:hypothetical protein THAOC_26870 [Thalassiosira oceanica]|uniref:Uncharacterized protein n=1 Tax=Thalassiosira oceanica TaxID=159749 RepID=K0S443_THAOC|nr:hypothetical protein THAOC_26870 [Thalassiosira oceanica]|eukprot:EJK53647.1 hypothetical protein THAOC_26870 [Thalassiosira oceanica]
MDLGLTEAAANSMRNDQGMENTEHWVGLDYEDLKNLISTTRKPGDGVDCHAISFAAANNLAVALTMMRHLHLVERPFTFAQIRRNGLGPYKPQYKLEAASEESSTKPDVPKLPWREPIKVISLLDTYLSCVRGTASGCPLNYTIRRRAVPPAAGDDPATNYRTMDQEKVARAPIFLPGAADLNEDDVSGEPWSQVKKTRHDRSGRKMYNTYVSSALGANHLDHEVKGLHSILQNLTSTGPKRNWTLDNFLTKHADAHETLASLVEYGYTGLDDRCRVLLITSLKAKQGVNHRNVSELRSGTKLEDRYYSTEEFEKLSEDQKDKLFRLREERSDASKKKANSKKKAAQKQADKVKNQREELKSSKRKIKKANARIAKLESQKADADDELSLDSSGELGAARR